MGRSTWCFVASILALAAGTAEAVTIRVPDDHPTIQAAVDAAASGDTVLVFSGYYVENILMKDGVALLGTGTEMPVISSASGSSVVVCLGVFTAETRIEGFLLEGATAWSWDSGVHCDDASATIRYNVIRHNRMGVLLKESRGHAIIEHNTIISNNDCGIQLYNGDVPVPSGTSLIRNNILVGNTLFGIYRGAGAGEELPLAPDVDYNDVWSNGEDYWNVSAGAHHISADPLFCEPSAGNYFLHSWSPCVGAGEMGADIGALGVGCGASTVEPTTWGVIKAMYR